MRKIESNFMASSESGARLPCTDTQASLPRRTTSMTAPGISPSSMFWRVAASMRLSCADDRPTSSGLAASGAGISACGAAGSTAANENTAMAVRRKSAFMAFSPSVDDGRLDHGTELVAQGDAIGIAHLHHVDGDQLFLGIDPEQRAGVARPAIFADRAGQSRFAGGGAHLETQPEAQAGWPPGPMAGVISGHEAHRLLTQNALAVQCTLVGQRGGEAQVVFHRRQQPAAAGLVLGAVIDLEARRHRLAVGTRAGLGGARHLVGRHLEA